jgi:hypothetical protein
MTRVVVIGPYPPTDDPAGDAVLETVRRLRADGATVTVVSPTPSAAPEHGDARRWAGARRIARVVRGADRVVWFATEGATPAPPLRRALARVASVDCRLVGTGPHPTAEGPDGSVSARARWLRAGLPTYLRTLRARWSRRR